MIRSSGKYKMNSFVGVTDNDWFACVTLLKQKIRDVVDPGYIQSMTI